MESVRVRLMFEDPSDVLTDSQISQGLNQSWLLLKPNQHPNFSAVSAHLRHIFDLHDSCPNGLILSMDGFVLPSFESTCILKDKDIISVKKKGGTSTNIVKIGELADSVEKLENVEKQRLDTAVPLLANEECEKEEGGYQSESEEDEAHSKDDLPLENSSSGQALSKKRKASKNLWSSKKKKHRLVVPDGVEKDHQTNQIERNHDEVVISKKSPCKKKKTSNAKSKRNLESPPESSSHDELASSVKSDQLQENDKTVEEMSHAPNVTRKLPSRSARRKKAKRQWLRAMAKIGKKEVVSHTKGPVNRKKSQSKTEKKEVDCQLQGHLHWNQSHEEHHENVIEHKETNQKDDGENDIVPIVIRPGHIRFEPLGEGEAVRQSQVSMETFQWNGITSKKKWQKWGTEKNFSSQKNEDENFNKDHSDMAIIEDKVPLNDSIDFDKLLPLPSLQLPKEGDVIAYCLLELSSTLTPELSSFRVGRISWYKPESKTIKLVPLPEYPIILEKLGEDESVPQPDNSLYSEDGSLEIDFSSLVDVRIVKQSNSESVKAVADEVHEGPTDKNKDPISNLVPSSNDKQKDTPNTENANVNMWDHFSGALSAKKAELLEESSWIKGTPGRSAWSYRALRGSALGPALALLRSNKDI